MAEVEKSDIKALHDRIDTVIEGQQSNRIIIARIETKIEQMHPKPCDVLENHLRESKSMELHSHTQPCNTLQDHLTKHKETRALWEKPIVAAIVGLIKLGIVALISAELVLRSKGP